MFSAAIPHQQQLGNLSDENRVLESQLVSKTDNRIKFKNGAVNLNWKHTFDSTGKELTADFDYVVYGNVSDMVLTTDYYNNMLHKTGSSSLKGHLPSGIDIFTFKTDYTHPVKGGRIRGRAEIQLCKER